VLFYGYGGGTPATTAAQTRCREAEGCSSTRTAGWPASRQYWVVDRVTCSWPRCYDSTEHATVSSARFDDPLAKRQFTDGKGGT
jgi:hypothetical protein